MIDLVCRDCKKALRVRDELAGSRVRCPQCGRSLKAPVPTADLEEADDELDAPAPPPGKVKKRKNKPRMEQKGGQGVPTWVWLAAGGVGLLLLVVVIIVVVVAGRTSRSAEKKVPVDAAGGALAVDKNVAGNDDKSAIAEAFFQIQAQNAAALAKCKDAASLDAAAKLFREQTQKLSDLDRRYRASKDPRRGVLAQVSAKYPKAMLDFEKQSNRLQGAIGGLKATSKEVEDFDAAHVPLRAAIIRFLEAADADR